jgi:hypothetical protein
VLNCAGISLTCELTNAYHSANGQVQFDRVGGACKPRA